MDSELLHPPFSRSHTRDTTRKRSWRYSAALPPHALCMKRKKTRKSAAGSRTSRRTKGDEHIWFTEPDSELFDFKTLDNSSLPALFLNLLQTYFFFFQSSGKIILKQNHSTFPCNKMPFFFLFSFFFFSTKRHSNKTWHRTTFYSFSSFFFLFSSPSYVNFFFFCLNI